MLNKNTIILFLFLILILILILTISCSDNTNETYGEIININYTLEDEDSTGPFLKGNHLFNQLTSLEDYEPGPVLYLGENKYVISDRGNNNIYYIDDNEINNIISFGVGIAEVTEISKLETTDKGFFVASFSDDKDVLIEFDKEGNYLSSYKTFYQNVICSYANGFACISYKNTDVDGNLIHCFNDLSYENNYQSSSFSTYRDQKINFPDNSYDYLNCLLSSNKNYLFLTNRNVNYLFSFNYNGELVRKIYINPDKAHFAQDPTFGEDGEYEKAILINMALTTDENGFVFMLKGYTLRGNGIIHVLSENGQLLGMLKIDCARPFQISCRQGKILVVGERYHDKPDITIMEYNYSHLVDEWKKI